MNLSRKHTSSQGERRKIRRQESCQTEHSSLDMGKEQYSARQYMAEKSGLRLGKVTPKYLSPLPNLIMWHLDEVNIYQDRI